MLNKKTKKHWLYKSIVFRIISTKCNPQKHAQFPLKVSSMPKNKMEKENWSIFTYESMLWNVHLRNLKTWPACQWRQFPRRACVKKSRCNIEDILIHFFQRNCQPEAGDWQPQNSWLATGSSWLAACIPGFFQPCGSWW